MEKSMNAELSIATFDCQKVYSQWNLVKHSILMYFDLRSETKRLEMKMMALFFPEGQTLHVEF